MYKSTICAEPKKIKNKNLKKKKKEKELINKISCSIKNEKVKKSLCHRIYELNIVVGNVLKASINKYKREFCHQKHPKQWYIWYGLDVHQCKS